MAINKETSILASDIEEIASRLADKMSEFEGKTILMSGGGGFLGRYFASFFSLISREYLSKPCRVVLLDNHITSDSHESDLSAIEFVSHDVTKPWTGEERFDFIIHAAGIASPFYYRKYPMETLEVATTGTKNLLELARRDGARLMFFSSSEIYGDPDSDNVPTAESYRGNVSCLGPRACYDESKRLGETLCRIYHEQYGVRSRIVRPFNVFGPGMRQVDYRVLPNFASKIAHGQAVKVYGSGNQTRTYCYITDAIVGFTRVMLDGVHGDPYNIGNPDPEVSVLELVRHIETALGRPVPAHQVDYPDSYPADEPNRRCPDITKAKLHVDYAPKVDLTDGLQRFLTWANSAYV